MFGGGNDNAAMQPADHQDATTDSTTLSTPAPSGYDNNSYMADSSDGAAPVAAPVDAALQAPIDDASTPDTPVATSVSVDNAMAPMPDDLVGIKQQALQQLSPLVGHLDQTPEEKFRTTMMMIQASDNADLIKDAYAAAGQISDEKARAQALLDVVNEINYFTQHQDQQQQ